VKRRRGGQALLAADSPQREISRPRSPAPGRELLSDEPAPPPPTLNPGPLPAPALTAGDGLLAEGAHAPASL